MMESSVLKVGRGEDGWICRVEGPGRVRESPAFQKMVDRLLDQADDARLIVDLSECEMLDSTFLGCLAALYGRYAQGGMPRIVLYAPDDVRQRLFGPSQIDRHLQFRAVAPESDGEWMDVPISVLDERSLGRHIMESHKTLAQRGGPLAAAFAAIAQQFADELSGKAVAEPGVVTLR